MNDEETKKRFQQRFSVSRETIERLEIFETLIRKWNPAINLVAKSTLDDLWNRHFLDSAETFRVAGLQAGRWLDIGTGGGFPGMVVAIIAKDLTPGVQVTCVESDIRKCEFLRTVARATGVPAKVLSRRVQETPPQNADIISARALSSLGNLLDLAAPHLAKDGHAVLHKGQNWQAELEEALEHRRFTVEKHENPTHTESVILKIGDIAGE